MKQMWRAIAGVLMGGIVMIALWMPHNGMAAQRFTCPVGGAPVVNIHPESRPIRYDFSQSAATLTALRAKNSQSYDPYAGQADAVTAGMRHDTPMTGVEMEWAVVESPDLGVGCIQFKSVNVSVKLAPIVYVAREYANGPCRKMILEHELKHVAIDREIMNRYVRVLGQLMKNAVDQTGVVGPYPLSESKKHQESMKNRIEHALHAQDDALRKEMYVMHAQVDTKAEYDRFSRLCGTGHKK